MNQDFIIRPFEKQDAPALLALMKALARFEGYIDQFCVTENDLIAMGLGPKPNFSAVVASSQEQLLGYGVYYHLPFTYDLRPTLIMKELFVSNACRGLGVGQALFDTIKEQAKCLNAARLEWLVLPSNTAAKKFYQNSGGVHDTSWENWHTPGLSVG